MASVGAIGRGGGVSGAKPAVSHQLKQATATAVENMLKNSAQYEYLQDGAVPKSIKPALDKMNKAFGDNAGVIKVDVKVGKNTIPTYVVFGQDEDDGHSQWKAFLNDGTFVNGRAHASPESQ